VVYVNGKEIARGDVKPNTGAGELADDYTTDDPKAAGRTLADVKIPSSALRKGVNVLALEVRRSAMPSAWVDTSKGMTLFKASTCALMSAALTAGTGDAVTPNVYRPAGVYIWNSSIMTQFWNAIMAIRTTR